MKHSEFSNGIEIITPGDVLVYKATSGGQDQPRYSTIISAQREGTLVQIQMTQWNERSELLGDDLQQPAVVTWNTATTRFLHDPAWYDPRYLRIEVGMNTGVLRELQGSEGFESEADNEHLEPALVAELNERFQQTIEHAMQVMGDVQYDPYQKALMVLKIMGMGNTSQQNVFILGRIFEEIQLQE